MAIRYATNTTASLFTTAANYSDTAANASGDTLYLNHLGTGGFTSGLASGIGSGAGAETFTMYCDQTFTGPLGAVASGAATYLSFSATLETFTAYIGRKTGQGSGTGSGRLFFDCGNVTTATFWIDDSASVSTDTYFPPILIKGGTTLNIYMKGGSVGVAARPGETTTLALAKLTQGTGSARPNLLLGAGVTATLIEAETGTILSHSNNTTTMLNLNGDASYTHDGTGDHTTASCHENAIFNFGGTGTGTQITTLNLSGTFNRQSQQAITIATTNIYEDCTLDLNNGVTNAATTTLTTKNYLGCGYGDFTVRTPKTIGL